MKWISAMILFSSLGCSHLSLMRTENSQRGGEAHIYEMNSFLFSTLGFTKLPPENEICHGSHLEFIDMEMSQSDVWTTIATLGIYVPHRVTVTCTTALNSSH